MKTHNHYFITIIDFVHHNLAESENISRIHKLLNSVILSYYAHAVAKSTAEPRNSNNLDKANKSTPLNRAIFVCSSRTPKETTQLKIQLSEFLSMVACSGKGSPFAVHLVEQFSSPLHATAQTLESLAVTPQLLDKDTVMKRFKFLTASRLIITIYANNRQEAENKIKWTNKPICIGLNLPSIQGVQYA